MVFPYQSLVNVTTMLQTKHGVCLFSGTFSANMLKRAFCRTTSLLGVILGSALSTFSFAASTEFRISSAEALATATRTVKPGDTIVMTDGVWRDAPLAFRAEGKAGKPIVLKAATPGKVVLTGNSWLRMAGSYLVVQDLVFQACTSDHDVVAFHIDPRESAATVKKSWALTLKAQHCRLQNCALYDCDPADLNLPKNWIALYGVDNQVDHCLLQGKAGAGPALSIYLSGEQGGHHVMGNRFTNIGGAQTNSDAVLRVGVGDRADLDGSVTVESNFFESCQSGNVLLANFAAHNNYLNNFFYKCKGVMDLSVGEHCTARSNVFVSDNSFLNSIITGQITQELQDNTFSQTANNPGKAEVATSSGPAWISHPVPDHRTQHGLSREREVAE